MKKYMLEWRNITEFLKTKGFLFNIFFLLLFTVFGLGFAKVTPVTIDKQLQQFINNKQTVVTKEIKVAREKEAESVLKIISSVCHKSYSDLLTSTQCTVKDSKGQLVTIKASCQGDSCKLTKAVHEKLKITQTPTYTEMQASPNLPPQSQVSTEKWLKIFAGLIYVILTVYLFIAASSNLIKREILFLVVDLLLWAALTSAMYVVFTGGL